MNIRKKIANKELFSIDFGSTYIRLLNLKKDANGDYHLEGIGQFPTPANTFSSETIENKEKLAEIINELLMENSISSKWGMFVAPTGSSFSKVITVNAVNEKKLAEVMPFEIGNSISDNLQDLYTDYYIINFDKEKSKYTVLFTAVKSKRVNELKEIFEIAGLVPCICDVEHFVLANTLNYNYPNLEDINAIVDIGHRSTSISVLKGSEWIYGGDLPDGGNGFTETLVDELSVDFAEAEKIKSDATHDLSKKADELLKSGIEDLLTDIFQQIEFAVGSDSAEIKKVYFTGGGSLTRGLLESSASIMKCECEKFDPMLQIKDADADIDQDYKEKLKSFFAICGGLSLRTYMDNW